MIHYTHPRLATRAFEVALIGAGGSGSLMLTRLARLAYAMRALGHPGFKVTVYDPDTVSEANIGRQMFSPSDVGFHKAHILVDRVNRFFGLPWQSMAVRYGDGEHGEGDGDLVVVCVDSRHARRAIHNSLRARWMNSYVLDLGNRASDGQVVLGQVIARRHGERAREGKSRKETPPNHVDLPDPYQLLPELVNTKIAEDDTPSCSVAEALERQELFVNDDVVNSGAEILLNMLRHGQLEWHGAFTNSRTGKRQVINVDPALWKRMAVGNGAKARKGKR
jgi:PRTRC genetic system ThiF family protein